MKLIDAAEERLFNPISRKRSDQGRGFNYPSILPDSLSSRSNILHEYRVCPVSKMKTYKAATIFYLRNLS